MTTKSKIAFVGSAGIPNRYGGFESFVEQVAPKLVELDHPVVVTCDAALYPERTEVLRGVRLKYVSVRANGPSSTLHDLVAFFSVARWADAIVVLGVSAGPLFLVFRALCSLRGKRLIVNIDGIEWRRAKHSLFRRLLLRLFDAVAQMSAHVIVYDNQGLFEHLLPFCRAKGRLIAYPGDHARRAVEESALPTAAGLTICRIEPENNIELLIRGALASRLETYTLVGNWEASAFGRGLRARYGREHRLRLLDPIYEPARLDAMRGSCTVYLHGHSVGGSNPSLIEMMFCRCAILAFDCTFNRFTASGRAYYFSDAAELASAIDAVLASGYREDSTWASGQYTAAAVAQRYSEATSLPLE